MIYVLYIYGLGEGLSLGSQQLCSNAALQKGWACVWEVSSIAAMQLCKTDGSVSGKSAALQRCSIAKLVESLQKNPSIFMIYIICKYIYIYKPGVGLCLRSQQHCSNAALQKGWVCVWKVSNANCICCSKLMLIRPIYLSKWDSSQWCFSI